MAEIAVPLNVLVKTGAPWTWTDVHRNAFHKLKQCCAETPVLAIPSANANMALRCDASREAVGVALYQQDAEGYLQPIEFRSKAFADRKFDVQTDNAALSQIFTSKDMFDL